MRATKDSGVDWLGEIPADWDVRPCWSSFRRVKQTGFPEEELLSVYRDHGVVPKSSRDDNHNVESEDLTSYQLVRVGDMVMNKMKAWQGSIALSDHRGIVSPAYFVYRPTQEFSRKYFHYLLRSAPYVAHYNRISKGVRVGQWDLDPTYFRTTSLVVPPVREQRRIADFLDRETAKIDALIAKQEQLITTLDKRRQAVISKFVSKGLNPDAPMTQDSVNVLGPAPRHWTVKRLKYSIVTSKNGVWGEEPRGDESDFWCVRIADFDRPSRSVKPFPRTVRSVTMPERFGRTLARGDLIIEKSGGGDQAPVGCVVMYDYEEPAVCSNFAARLSIANGNSSKYWTYAHAALYFHGVPWKSIKQTSGIQNLDLSSYLNEVVAFPPLAEQLEIAEHLDEATRDIDLLVEKSVATTSVLKERRQALISAAVTGKLEVGV